MDGSITSSQRGNLPIPLSSIIGRQSEIDQISAKFARSDCRLLTLTGPAGVGKTRLSIEVAHRVQDLFGDGIWLVELASLSEPTLVDQTIAAVCGIREERDHPTAIVLQRQFRSQRVLLLLDNCEHLTGPVTSIARKLLEGCPGMTILATSRQRLSAPGEIVYRVEPLAVAAPEAPDRQPRAEDGPAVALFLARAQDVVPAFNLDEIRAEAVASICRRLDGIPLAIELAASWVAALDVTEIDARLDDRFQLLREPGSATAPHRSTLRDAFDWSYALLSDPEQRLLMRLAVFAEGLSLDAIEKICSDRQLIEPEIVHLVGSLVEKSLLVATPRAQHHRYRMLETVRAFAREKLVLAGESTELQRRHAEFYAALCEQIAPGIWSSEPSWAMRQLDDEHENIRAALRWSVGRGEVEIALRLATAMGPYWRVRGHLSEGRQWLEGALDWQPDATGARRASALEMMGHLCRDQGDLDTAASNYEASLRLKVTERDSVGVAMLLNHLGIVAQFRGQHDRATRLQEESLALFRQTGSTSGIAMSLVSLGALAQLQQQHKQASCRYREAMDLFGSLGDSYGVAACLNNLGNLASAMGDQSTAEQYYLQALEMFQGLHDDHEAAACLSNLGGIARSRGDAPLATERFRQSLNRFVSLGDSRGVRALVLCLASMADEQNEPVRATTLLGALESMRTLDGVAGETSLGDQHLDMLRTLGTTLGERAFNEAFRTGQAMTMRQAVQLAMEDAGPAGCSRSNPLTRREKEVAGLIAEGLTNRQISERLFIAERTVDSHVEHILAKLGFRSRTQVATWIVTQQTETT